MCKRFYLPFLTVCLYVVAGRRFTSALDTKRPVLASLFTPAGIAAGAGVGRNEKRDNSSASVTGGDRLHPRPFPGTPHGKRDRFCTGLFGKRIAKNVSSRTGSDAGEPDAGSASERCRGKVAFVRSFHTGDQPPFRFFQSLLLQPRLPQTVQIFAPGFPEDLIKILYRSGVKAAASQTPLPAIQVFYKTK